MIKGNGPGAQLDGVEAHGQAIKDDQLSAGHLSHISQDLDTFQGL